MKTREEIEAIKAKWLKYNEYTIEETYGKLEPYELELEYFQRYHILSWQLERAKKRIKVLEELETAFNVLNKLFTQPCCGE